ncbi:MAG: ABC transporter ATP-binding protein [Bacillota bacterium]|jgi:branched-chain amino acid transport system ATP-binding protein|nr:ABC transporter ATP-binding protein [Bacillota bacterium]HHU29972.1 ABC transporter ATP-binding protein [Bacillota bacterium]
MQILQVEGLSKNFGGLAAVSGVDLQVESGEILGLIGPNGAGKTTLFNLISGTIAPNSGKVIFNNEVISGLKPHAICKKGLVRTFQSCKIFPGMSIYQNVLLGALFGSPGKISREQADVETREILEFTELAELSNVPAESLTFEKQKKVEVARALATKPKLLMLDEMMAGLNPTEVAESMELVRKIRDKGITVIMIEHVMKAIMNICERIIVLDHGKKIAEGTPEEISKSKTVIEIYLGE